MKTLVVGSRGSMGRRYCAILRYLKESLMEADMGDMWWEWEFDRVIIATPTHRHTHDIEIALQKKKPILCEKPVSKIPGEIMGLEVAAAQMGVDVRMVNNWKFAINLALTRAQKTVDFGKMEIEYNYYDSGRDSFFWDCIQLIYLAGKFKWDRTCPVYEAKVNGIDVTMEHIHASYMLMVSEWLHGDKGKLWSLGDAIAAAQKVKKVIVSGYGGDSGEIDFVGTPK